MNKVKRLEHELTTAAQPATMGGMTEKFDGTAIDAIAGRLRATREALGLNQTEFCARAGVARNTYNQWEKGKGRPDIDGAMALCRAFRITLDWIYFGDPSKLPNDIASKLHKAAS